MGRKFSFPHKIFSLICQSVYLSWEIAVKNVVCISAYFCGGHKIIYGYNFVAPLIFETEPFFEFGIPFKTKIYHTII